MPRYFFHVMDGPASIDGEGTELIDVAEARREAVRTAGEMLATGECDGMLKGRPWSMQVADETGRLVYDLSFAATRFP